MGDDLDLGDCADCKCDDCDCDCGCKCDDCDCNCFDGCCTGGDDDTDYSFCCFWSESNKTSSNTSTGCSSCCCCFRDKRKGFCSRLRSCFRADPSPPSSPPQPQPKMENVLPMGYFQDGRYPTNEDRFPPRYEKGYKMRASWEEVGMPPREQVMDRKWSDPVKHGEYGGHL